MPSKHRSAGIAAIAVAALLAACTAPAPMVQPDGEAVATVPEGLEDFYAQEVSWSECDTGFECGSVRVPIDYEEPGGNTIDIAVKRELATGERVGSLFVNPGGPGGSGIEMVEQSAYYFSSELRDSFDIVGFDPRGVGESAGVRCLDDAELAERYETTYDLESQTGWDDFVEDGIAYGEACLENTGEVMEFLDTVSAARDLDVLRGVIGDETLTYLGFSYGTFLGATYAELFPERVGRLVLDGAIDPSLSYAEVTAGQNLGFQRAYESFLQNCLAGTCPFNGTVDQAWDDTVALLADLSTDPAPTGDRDRPATDGDLINTLIITMYSTDWWPTLTEALRLLVEEDDGSLVLELSDLASEREPDGSYPPDEGAFRLIDCLDYRVELDRDAIEAEADALAEANDLYGPYLGYGEVGCATLPFQSTAERGPVTADGVTAPIVVIGTSRDPATPYEWSEALADQLATGVLLSYDGDGHTAYGRTNCIDDPVDEFLIDGVAPQDGLQC